MGIFYNLSKIMTLVPFILIIDGTPKQHKMLPQKDFYQSLNGLSISILVLLITGEGNQACYPIRCKIKLINIIHNSVPIII